MVGTGPRLVIPAQRGDHEVFAVVKGSMNKVKVAFPSQRAVDLTGESATAAPAAP